MIISKRFIGFVMLIVAAAIMLGMFLAAVARLDAGLEALAALGGATWVAAGACLLRGDK